MGPHAIRLSVRHHHDAVAKTELLERVGLAVDDGVEPDPGAAAYSEGDEHRLAAKDIVGHVVKRHHLERVGTALTADGQPEYPVIWSEERRGFRAYHIGVV
jgi:hypothetical protein